MFSSKNLIRRKKLVQIENACTYTRGPGKHIPKDGNILIHTYIHSPKGLFGTAVQFLINAII